MARTVEQVNTNKLNKIKINAIMGQDSNAWIIHQKNPQYTTKARKQLWTFLKTNRIIIDWSLNFNFSRGQCKCMHLIRLIDKRLWFWSSSITWINTWWRKWIHTKSCSKIILFIKSQKILTLRIQTNPFSKVSLTTRATYSTQIRVLLLHKLTTVLRQDHHK